MSGYEGPMLTVHDVTKRYGALVALDRVSFRVGPGEIVCLMGPNGAGKTTLFQILSGLFVADSGEAAVLGHDLRREPVAALARLGLVFQQQTLDPELTVAANLRFHARLHGMRLAAFRGRMRDELARVGLAGAESQRVSALSGGNRRRVELARALLHEPDLLLMDEPTTGLDPVSRSDLIRHVRSLCREQGLGVLWATHLVDEAERADRVVILDRGRVLDDGTPSALVARHGAASLEAAFVGLTGGGSPAPSA